MANVIEHYQRPNPYYLTKQDVQHSFIVNKAFFNNAVEYF